LLGFFGWFTLSSVFTKYPNIAWPQIEGLGKIVLPCIVGATLIDSREKLRQLAWVITLSAGFWAFRENEKYLSGQLLEVANQTAHLFAVGAGVALFLGFIEQRTIPKLISFACSGLLFHGVLIHMSRGAMVGLAVVGIVGVYLIPKTRQVVRWLVLASIAGFIMVGPSVQQEFATIFASEEERDYSAQSRLDLWTAMWRCSLDNPLTGVGLQAWPKVAPQYGFPEGKQGHGLWIQAMAETGILGGVMFIGFYACCVLSLWRYLRRPSEEIDPEYRLYATLVIASLCGWVVEAQFGSFYGVELPYYVAMMGIGVLRLTAERPTYLELEPYLPFYLNRSTWRAATSN
jgi:O-antigen ligase